MDELDDRRHSALAMKRTFLFGAILSVTILAVAIGTNHYLFLRRLSDTDLKGFHHVIYTLSSAKTEDQRAAAIRQVSADPELRHYDVALVGDHIVMLHTCSLFSDAYIVAHHLGRGDAWAVGWLRERRFSHMGTYTPPTNLGGS